MAHPLPKRAIVRWHPSNAPQPQNPRQDTLYAMTPTFETELRRAPYPPLGLRLTEPAAEMALRPVYRNALLQQLPADVIERIGPYLHTLQVASGTVLHEAGVSATSAYFPCGAIASLVYETADGESVETARVGFEGMVGISLLTGGDSALTRAVVYGAGAMVRLPGAVLKAELARGGALLQLLLRYSQSLLTQMAQTAVCNRHHSVEQQLCRLLLQSLDRMDGTDLMLTHEVIASLLGVRREGVTEAAGRLQRRGHISYRRGRISILDRLGLGRHTCECYGVVKKESERLLPSAAPTHLNA